MADNEMDKVNEIEQMAPLDSYLEGYWNGLLMGTLAGSAITFVVTLLGVILLGK